MGIKEVLTAPRSPWQRAYVERVIGTIRRECLDHVIVLNEASLYRHVKAFLAYYHESRTRGSFSKTSSRIKYWRTSSPRADATSSKTRVKMETLACRNCGRRSAI